MIAKINRQKLRVCGSCICGTWGVLSWRTSQGVHKIVGRNVFTSTCLLQGCDDREKDFANLADKCW